LTALRLHYKIAGMEHFPLSLRKGGAVAKIYRTSNRGRPLFALTYHTPEGRKVALEMGNSPAMIFSNYRQLVTPAQAQAWFAILPEKAANVITFKKNAA